MTLLFTPLQLRGEKLRNRVGVSPMCQYSSDDGFATDWHLVHLGGFAVGGAALVMTEACAVSPEGRISPQDLGIWKDDHLSMLARIAEFIDSQGAVPGIQLAHAGRKASTRRPWEGSGAVPVSEGGWSNVMAPSAVAFAEDFPHPQALTEGEVAGVVKDFRSAAARAVAAGFRFIEVHAAHGYLIHEFLSPLSNRRDDRYGGSFDNRVRLLVQVVDVVRADLPERLPLCVRISATDWAEGGWNPDESVRLAAMLAARGVDIIDCSTGGLVPGVTIPLSPGYQVPFAARIRKEGGIATAAVGLITEPRQAAAIIDNGEADLLFMARELLRQPHWPLLAAHALGAPVEWPPQYARARPR